MIKKTLVLFKVSLMESFKIDKYKSNKKQFLFPILMTFLYIALFIASYQYNLMFMHMMHESGLENVVFMMFNIMAVVAMLMTGIYKARGALFGTRDNELLFSMPIKNESILLMRILNMMFFNYLISSVLVFPSAIAYSMFGKNVNIINLIISYIFLPFIPTLLSALFGYFMGMTISKSKHKSMIEAGILFILIFAAFSFISKFGTILSDLLDMENDIMAVFSKVYYPVVLINNGVINSSYLSILIFAAVSALFMYLFLMFFNKAFVSINQRMNERISNKNFEIFELKTRGKCISLLFKELRLYSQSSLHMLNTCFGSISILLFALSTFFYDPSSMLSAFKDFGITLTSTEFVSAICVTMVALSCTTPASISMEGKSLWCLRSLPVKEMTIFWSKMLVDLCFIMPANVIAMFILSFTMKVPFIDMLCITLLMVICGFAMTHFGLLLNLLFPKMKFKSEVEVVKESMSANLAVYIPMILTSICIVAYLILKNMISMSTFLLILSAITFVVLLILHIIIRTYGIKKFKTLYC